jgi:hypothetical protein
LSFFPRLFSLQKGTLEPPIDLWFAYICWTNLCPFHLRMSDDNVSEKHDAATVERLRRYQTADSVLLPIPRDAFEKLYLSPKTPAAGKLRFTFGNPTPIALMGFLLAAMPTAMITMGWRGAGGNGAAIL